MDCFVGMLGPRVDNFDFEFPSRPVAFAVPVAVAMVESFVDNCHACGPLAGAAKGRLARRATRRERRVGRIQVERGMDRRMGIGV